MYILAMVCICKRDTNIVITYKYTFEWNREVFIFFIPCYRGLTRSPSFQ
jgi:hypothetical protein